MDFCRTVDALPQGNQEEHPGSPAVGMGPSDSGFQQNPSISQTPQMFNNLGATWSTAGMTASYTGYASQPLPTQNFNPFFPYVQNGVDPTGVNAMGFGQTVPIHSSNSLLHGYGANLTGAKTKPFDQTMPNQSSGSHSSQFGTGGSRENPTGGSDKHFRQPLLSTPNPVRTNLESHQTVANESSNSQPVLQRTQSGPRKPRKVFPPPNQNFSPAGQPLLPTPNPTGTNLDSHQTMANESSNSQYSQPVLRRTRRGPRKPRKVFPPPNQNFSPAGAPGQDGAGSSLFRGNRCVPDGSQYGGNSSAPNSSQCGGHSSAPSFSRYGENRPAPDSSQYGGNRPMLEVSQFGGNLLDNSRYRGNQSVPHGSQYGGDRPIPGSSQYGGDFPVLDAINFGGSCPVPDGTTSVKYPAPDLKNLLFDSNTGYRFDPTTGLHYDANSGFYLNNQLKVLLRWDARTSTYVLVSNSTSSLATPATLLNKTPSSGSMMAGLSQESLKALARELAPLLKSGTQQPDPYVNPGPVHERTYKPDLRLNCDTYETPQQRNRIHDFHPGDAKRYRWSSPERPTSSLGEADVWDREEPETWGSYRSPSPDELRELRDEDQYAVRDRRRYDRRDSIAADRTWDDRQELIPVNDRWDDRRDPQLSCGRRDRELSTTEIHRHNLKDICNLYGRYFPETPPLSSFLLVAPVPPRSEMSRQDVVKCLEDAVSSDRLTFRSIHVHQGGFGAPCNYALIRFSSEDAALYWYKLHRGTIGLKNFRTRYSTFLFFAEDNWICSKQSDDDKGCEIPTPNFPYRTLCYKCFAPKTKLESPIVKKESPTKWIGVSQLDWINCSSIMDVLQLLPPHKGIKIESTEFLREPSGLPIGLCVFQVLDKEESTDFFKILKNERFDVSYVHLDRKALDFPSSSSARMLRGRETAHSRLGPKAKASLPPGERTALPAKERLGSNANYSGVRRRRLRKRKPEPRDPHEIIIENLGEKFLVVDECQEQEKEEEEEKKTSEPFVTPRPLLRKEIRKLIADQLKNVVSVHKQNSEDPDNVFCDLFVEPPALRAFVLLAPLPGDSDMVKKELEKMLTSDGDDFHSVGVFQGKGLGAPCHYGLIQFSKPFNSLSWYNKHKGLLHLNDGANEQLKAFMYFTENNWACRHCGFTNFPLRTWCNGCFKNRNENNFSAVSESCTPTKWLGISSVGLPLNVSESNFTTDVILASLPEEESKRLVSCEMLLVDKGLPGLCVLEARDSKDCENLQKHLLSKGWKPSFLQMHCEPSDAVEASDVEDAILAEQKASDTEGATLAEQPDQKETVPVNQGDPFKHIFENSKPSQCILLSPAPTLDWSTVKEKLDNILTDDGQDYSYSYDACQSEVYGSPHDYIQVHFIDLEKAVSWYDKHNGFLVLKFPEKSSGRELTFTMHLYYSESAWPCRACSALNFPARSLCHKCYAHRDEDGFTPVTISNNPTRWVGISSLRQTVYDVEQVKRALPPLDSFKITRMHFIKEPNPLLHGLCVIETPTASDGQILAEYIHKHEALKSKSIFVNLNQRPGEESCEQHSGPDNSTPPEPVPTQSDSTAILTKSDDADSCGKLNDSPDNFYLWWKHFIDGTEEGEDILENFFKDRYIMPKATGNSVFAPLPLVAQIVGSMPCSHFRKVYLSLLEKAGVSAEIAKSSKVYPGKNLGSPCSYTILTFKTASDAQAWYAKHNGKWVIDLVNGSKWTSFLHPCSPNWKCRKCSKPNFPLRVYCFWCYEPRVGGPPAAIISEAPTRFVGIAHFQTWCATEELLLKNIKILGKMKDNQQLKEVRYPTEPSGISLGLCVLELESVAVARSVLTHLIAATQKGHAISYLKNRSSLG